jgi:Eukaryotic aspartyl protease
VRRLLGHFCKERKSQHSNFSDTSSGGYTFACSAILPNLTLGIGSYRAVIPGKHINYAPSGSKCYGGIQSNAGFMGVSILGDIFFKSQFVIFDGSVNRRLGFAAKPT